MPVTELWNYNNNLMFLNLLEFTCPEDEWGVIEYLNPS